MVIKDYTTMVPLSDEWKEAVSLGLDAVWFEVGTDRITGFSEQIGLLFDPLLEISEYYTNRIAVNGKPTDAEWEKAVLVLERAKNYISNQV